MKIELLVCPSAAGSLPYRRTFSTSDSPIVFGADSESHICDSLAAVTKVCKSAPVGAVLSLEDRHADGKGYAWVQVSMIGVGRGMNSGQNLHVGNRIELEGLTVVVTAIDERAEPDPQAMDAATAVTHALDLQNALADLHREAAIETGPTDTHASMVVELRNWIRKRRADLKSMNDFQTAVREALRTPMGVTSIDQAKALVAEVEQWRAEAGQQISAAVLDPLRAAGVLGRGALTETTPTRVVELVLERIAADKQEIERLQAANAEARRLLDSPQGSGKSRRIAGLEQQLASETRRYEHAIMRCKLMQSSRRKLQALLTDAFGVEVKGSRAIRAAVESMVHAHRWEPLLRDELGRVLRVFMSDADAAAMVGAIGTDDFTARLGLLQHLASEARKWGLFTQALEREPDPREAAEQLRKVDPLPPRVTVLISGPGESGRTSLAKLIARNLGRGVEGRLVDARATIRPLADQVGDQRRGVLVLDNVDCPTGKEITDLLSRASEAGISLVVVTDATTGQADACASRKVFDVAYVTSSNPNVPDHVVYSRLGDAALARLVQAERHGLGPLTAETEVAPAPVRLSMQERIQLRQWADINELAYKFNLHREGETLPQVVQAAFERRFPAPDEAGHLRAWTKWAESLLNSPSPMPGMRMATDAELQTAVTSVVVAQRANAAKLAVICDAHQAAHNTWRSWAKQQVDTTDLDVTMKSDADLRALIAESIKIGDGAVRRELALLDERDNLGAYIGRTFPEECTPARQADTRWTPTVAAMELLQQMRERNHTADRSNKGDSYPDLMETLRATRQDAAELEDQRAALREALANALGVSADADLIECAESLAHARGEYAGTTEMMLRDLSRKTESWRQGSEALQERLNVLSQKTARVDALEDHLAREVRSSQALLRSRTELETLVADATRTLAPLVNADKNATLSQIAANVVDEAQRLVKEIAAMSEAVTHTADAWRTKVQAMRAEHEELRSKLRQHLHAVSDGFIVPCLFDLTEAWAAIADRVDAAPVDVQRIKADVLRLLPADSKEQGRAARLARIAAIKG